MQSDEVFSAVLGAIATMLLVQGIIRTARPWSEFDGEGYKLRFGWPMKLLGVITIALVIRLAVIFIETDSELPVWVLCVSIPTGLFAVLVSLELMIARIEIKGDYLYQTTLLGMFKRVPLSSFVAVDYSGFFRHFVLRTRGHGRLFIPEYMSGSSSLVAELLERVEESNLFPFIPTAEDEELK